MAEAAGSSSSSWEVEIAKMLADCRTPSAEKERRERQCIYRVLGWIKDTDNSKAYRPQVVALGPFHHDDPDLRPMEEHKRRAVAHLLKRSGKPLTAYIAAVKEVAEQLEAAYGKDLGKEWRGENRRRFVEMMVTDGCFLMELIQWGNPDYVPESGDPFFSEHSFLYMSSIITSDVLVMENQLPLLVIRSLFAVGYGVAPSATTDKLIHQMVLHCLGRGSDSVGDQPLALHPLDLYHSSLTFGGRHDRAEPGAGEETMPRAVEIHKAGVHFRRSDTDSLLDVHFNDGMLYMPTLAVDDDFERIFLNLLAFERLHAGAGNDVTAYMFFMDNVVDEAEDVSLLRSKGILRNYLGSDKAVAKLFNGTLSKGTVLSPSSAIGHVHRQVNAHCSKPWNKWRAYFTHTYLSNPWVFLSLVAATILLVATLLQTFYTVMPFYQQMAKFLGL